MKLLIKWLLSAVALLCVAYLYSGVEVRSFGAALIAALLIGLCNTIVRPILVVLTLPVTVITLGLFLFVLWAASSLAGSGFEVHGFGAALIGSVLYSLISLVIESLAGRLLLGK